MFRLFLVFALLFLAPLWVSNSAEAQPLPDRRPIVGVVVDGAGKPLEGAIISLRRDVETAPATFWGASAATDARGEFRFPLGELGRYFLSAELPGFAPIGNRWVVWTLNSQPLRLSMERLVTLQLSLARPDGTPAANSPFWVRLRGDGSAGQTTRRASTDAQGLLSIADLMPANYAVFAVSPDGFALQKGVALRTNAEQKMALQQGSTLKISIREIITQRPVGGAILSLVPETGAEALRLSGDAAEIEEDYALLAVRGDRLAQVSRDGDGTVSLFNVPPGRYRARLTIPGYQTAQTQAVLVEAGLESEISWILTPQRAGRASFALQLRGAGETAAQAGEYALRLMRIGENGALEPEGDTPFQPGGHPGRRALANEGGLVRVFPLSPGRYRVFVAPRTPGQDLESGPAEAASVDVTIGAETAPLQGATASVTLKSP